MTPSDHCLDSGIIRHDERCEYAEDPTEKTCTKASGIWICRTDCGDHLSDERTEYHDVARNVCLGIRKPVYENRDRERIECANELESPY
ncbi:hypothetical protein SAMN04488556_1445 [Halostagnicola kamekurae]|uniref:Uncharacterized protein n=1 Tax=Halostagnicola kamekurae TaxID=619731 RepID=A0A1I6QQH9_9EURY|nr:hypothetical protein SAMN04488556_1445 [Halostagnicola kamekurae]